MLLSEAIKRLQELLADVGDCELVVYDSGRLWTASEFEYQGVQDPDTKEWIVKPRAEVIARRLYEPTK